VEIAAFSLITWPRLAVRKSSRYFKQPEQGQLCSAPKTQNTCGGNVCGVEEVRGAFQEARGEIDGIIITLPNFGEERALWTRSAYPDSRFRCWCRPRRTARML